jgi:hypothetical protein
MLPSVIGGLAGDLWFIRLGVQLNGESLRGCGSPIVGCAFHHHRHRFRRQQYGLRCAVSELRGESVFDAARIGQVLSGSTATR